MNLSPEVWKELLVLKKEFANADQRFTRRAIQEHFDITEQDARFLLESCKNQDVLATVPLSKTTTLTEKNKILKREVNTHKKEILDLNKRLDVYGELCNRELQPPEWIAHSKASKSKVIATAILSDIHYGEVVDPAQVEWINKYDLEIANKRLETFFDKVCMLGGGIYADMSVEGLVLALAGDLLSGNIHDELAQTNDCTILEATISLSEKVCAGIEQLKKTYSKIHIPCVVGNHSRNYVGRPKAKNYVKDNYEFILYYMIEKHFNHDDAVTFQISESTDLTYKIYNTVFRLTHGANFRSGNGLAGPLIPVKRADHKLRTRSTAVDNSYDCLLLGHFHQYLSAPDIVMNGSIIGTGEYSYMGQFSHQVPQQSFFLTDAAHGRIADFPIFCQSDQETWIQEKPKHIFVGS